MAKMEYIDYDDYSLSSRESIEYWTRYEAKVGVKF